MDKHWELASEALDVLERRVPTSFIGLRQLSEGLYCAAFEAGDSAKGKLLTRLFYGVNDFRLRRIDNFYKSQGLDREAA